ncbi:MAG: histidine phosphatase family protein [Acidimicrobiales bacterium]|jgi:phosphohistidine phosphatase
MTPSEPAFVRHVWVLRHAKAEAALPDDDDHSRSLTRRGRRQAEAAQRFLSEARGRGAAVPRLVLCSSAARALQTAELVLPALGAEVTLEVEGDLYTAEADELIERLRRVEDEVASIMVVGHNPAFAELVQLLLSEADTAGRGRLVSFPTCALAQVGLRSAAWADLVAGSGRLEELFLPERRK